MKLLFVINTPSQAYFWAPIVQHLLDMGCCVQVLARRYQGTLGLLQHIGIAYDAFAALPGRRLKPLELGIHLAAIMRRGLRSRPDKLVGFGIDVSFAARMLHTRSLVFVDGEHLGAQWPLLDYSRDVIVTPEPFRGSFVRSRHVRIASYKELSYLHPDRFTADPSVYDQMGVEPGTRYAILRFTDLSAAHDAGVFGLSASGKESLVRYLSSHLRVLISSEGPLPLDLEPYALSVPFHRIHHALAFANLVVTDTGTMTTEAAVLGVPTIYCGSLAYRSGVFRELADRYELVHLTDRPADALQKGLEWVSDADRVQLHHKRLTRLLRDKADACEVMIDLLTQR